MPQCFPIKQKRRFPNEDDRYKKDIEELPNTEITDSSTRYGMFVLALDDIQDVNAYLPEKYI